MIKGTVLSDLLVVKQVVTNALGVSVSTVKRYLKRYPDFPANQRGMIYVSPGALKAWVEKRAVRKCPLCRIVMPP